MSAPSLNIQNPEKERDQTIGIHDVEYNTLILLSLEKALEHAECHKTCHNEIKDMN
jgi:hypothetical protein